jgi:transcriptional regulator with XRE-family HTH domain
MSESAADRVFQVVRDAGVPDRVRRSTLAKLCGVSVQAVRDWEEGKTKNIRHEHLVKIAKRYGVSLEYLITGSGEAEVLGVDDFAAGVESLPAEDRQAMIETLLATLPERERRALQAHLLRAVADDLAAPSS